MDRTTRQYQQVVETCRSLFLRKAADYGTAWRILRMPSVTDQIAIKAGRIRSIQEKQANLVGDSEQSEFVGIVNYCVIALMLLHLQDHPGDLPALDTPEGLAGLYDAQVETARSLMAKKNHDYGEAWRSMRISSITDLILMKILRLKQIEDNQGLTQVSEGPAANYLDMLNYAVFALILLDEASTAANQNP
ncbi:MAG: DUF1599 domain-containing protein [Bacteroidia bacterium]